MGTKGEFRSARRRTSTAVLVTVVVMVLLGGLLLGNPAPAHAQLGWGPCAAVHEAAGVSCATVRVPLDYSRPGGATISVTVSKIPARDPARRRGALFGNPGGPGVDAVGLFTMRLPAAIRDEWDLIAVQPRGLLSSTPLKCAHDDESGLSAVVDMGARNRAGCERFTPGYPRTITTANTARDIEVVRAVLGYPTLSLYGASYGALLMATYATLFPQRVDRLILDSAVNPALIWNQTLRVQSSPYRSRINAMMRWIAAHDARYHLGTTALQVYRRWSARIEAEAGVPPSVAGPPAQVGDVPPGLKMVAQQYLTGVNSTADTRARLENMVASVTTGATQDASSLLLLTRLAAPSRNIWPTVAARTAGMLTAPARMPPSVAARLANATDLQNVLLCNENQAPVQPLDVPALLYAAFVSRDVIDGPGLAYSSGVACAGAAPATRPIAVANRGLRTAPLQLQGVGDPQTPYRESLAMTRMMRSHLVTVAGGDHVALGRANRPLDDVVVEYLRTGRTSVTSVGEAPIVLNLDGSQWNSYIGRGR